MCILLKGSLVMYVQIVDASDEARCGCHTQTVSALTRTNCHALPMIRLPVIIDLQPIKMASWTHSQFPVPSPRMRLQIDVTCDQVAKVLAVH